MQKYTEAESRTNKFVLPRRNSISAEGKYTQKPRAMQMNLHIGMFHPEKPGGLGLTDTTGGTGSASRKACMAEA